MAHAAVDEPVIVCEDAGFSYDGSAFAFRALSLVVPRGQHVCVIGANGSGKSTLARHVNALLVPTEGRVAVLGHDTRNPNAAAQVRPRAGLVFQNPDDQLVASLVENDVAFGPENLGLDARLVRERVTLALQAVGLAGFERRETNTLSGGQKQRTAIAGVLAMDPDVVVLDEASAMLDPRGRAELAQTVDVMRKRGLTVVSITHFMEEAAHADRVVVMSEGRIVLDGTPDEVFSHDDELRALQLEVPFAYRMAHDLRKRGSDVPTCTSSAQLERFLAQQARCAHATNRKAGAGCGNGNKASRERGGESRSAAGASAHARTSCRERADAHGSAGSDAGASADTRADANRQQAASAIASSAHTAYDAHSARNAPACASADVVTMPCSADAPLIAFEHVSFTYNESARKRRGSAEQAPDPVWALHDVSFSLFPGELFGIAGHTGSGKSTLLQHMNGLAAPTRGRVLVNGADLADKHAAARARNLVGMVFQYPERQLFAATVYDDVAFGPRNLGLSADEVDTRVSEALNRAGLSIPELAARSPFELSGGQQRRVALAGVLACRPRVLVLDEPVAGLDPAARRALLTLVGTLRDDGLTVVMVSHAMEDLAELADRILVLNGGETYLLGTPEEVFADEDRLVCAGLALPAAQALALRLRKQGLPLPRALYRESTLAADLALALEKR